LSTTSKGESTISLPKHSKNNSFPVSSSSGNKKVVTGQKNNASYNHQINKRHLIIGVEIRGIEPLTL
jgi:hypothetical protein